jgi:regulatory protein
MCPDSAGKPAADGDLRAAYGAGLRLLARRELSEAQVRERLARLGFETTTVEETVARLRRAGIVDDARVAAAAARTEALVKRRGRLRVGRRLEAIGIPEDVAAQAVDGVFEGVDETKLVAEALSRRLRGPRAGMVDAAQKRRLYQQLIRQGFSPAVVVAELRRVSRSNAAADEDD